MVLRWLVILQAFLWFNVIVPGHTRGRIVLWMAEPLAKASSPERSSSCCASDKAPSAPSKSETPDSKRQKRCAVCFVAAASFTAPGLIDLPGFVDLSIPLVRFVEPVPVRATPALAYWPTGPPAFIS
jgi:hypothetical protein